MSQIQSSVGLITGIPIQETVDKLMSIAARPRLLLESKNTGLSNERQAIDQVSSLLLGFRFGASKLDSNSIYTSTTSKSSDKKVLSVAKNGDQSPKAGIYTFTPLQKATNHQLLSSSITDADSQLASGNFRIGIGGQVDRGVALSQLNGGNGFQTGSIRIYDRSGTSADIDLRAATSIDEVLQAINSNGTIDVTASIDGDSIKLTDNTGGSGTLRVREVGVGSTAASLGLDSINVAADEATGSDLFTLHSATQLTNLNDGTGVRLRDEVDDLEVTFADSTTLNIDLGDAKSLGDVVDAINAADPAKLTASISSDGNRLELVDLTAGGGTFAVSSIGTGSAAEDLGLTLASTGGTLTGSRLTSGLRDTLVSSLNGGQGVGTLGSIDIVDRLGNPAVSIDLSTAETLQQVVDAINDSSAEVTASINSARNGISLTDTSGGTGNLTITNADANNSADALGLTIDEAVASVNSGSLNRQVTSESTLLSSLNGGKGIDVGDFRITDSKGAQGAVSLNDLGSEAKTVGDVLDAINALNIGAEARINDSGDGIVLIDTAEGTKTLTVAEVGNGTTAADLRLIGASEATNEGGQQIIDGATSLSIDLSTLESDTAVSLSSLNDGAGISLGTFSITDSTGRSVVAVRLDEPGSEAFTVTDVIDKINERTSAAGIKVTASLNSSGTGIELTDTAGGDKTLTVTDLGSGTAAADLKLTGKAVTQGSEQTISSGTLFAAADPNRNRLDALAEKINAFDGGFSASTFFDGNGFRLSISSDIAGAATELIVDSSEASFNTSEVTRAKDAVLQIGGAETGGVVITSSDNTFENVIDGLDLTIEQISTLPITVEVVSDTSGVIDAAQDFVDSFNSFHDILSELTSFDSETLTTGLLFGRSEVLRVETDLSRVLSGSFKGSAAFKSLESVGISLDKEGKLSLDTDKLTKAYEEKPGEIRKFFTAEESGIVDQFHAVIDQLAGEEHSVLSSRSDAINKNIEVNKDRIESMQKILDRERERTLLEFYKLEETISKLQSNISSLDSIQYIPAFTRR